MTAAEGEGRLGGSLPAHPQPGASKEKSSALLKHELAFCLGQMRDRAAIPALLGVLQDSQQEPMVRHEAGMALQGSGCRCAMH